jgi:hypothetical protein
MLESSAIRTERLAEFGTSSAEQLRRLEDGPSDSRYARLVLEQVRSVISRNVAATIREADPVRKPERRFNLFNLVPSAFNTVRTAFGTGLGMWRQAFGR